MRTNDYTTLQAHKTSYPAICVHVCLCLYARCPPPGYHIQHHSASLAISRPLIPFRSQATICARAHPATDLGQHRSAAVAARPLAPSPSTDFRDRQGTALSRHLSRAHLPLRACTVDSNGGGGYSSPPPFLYTPVSHSNRVCAVHCISTNVAVPGEDRGPRPLNR